MRKVIIPLILIVMCLSFSGCLHAGKPNSFSSGVPSGWLSVDIREDISYDNAWEDVFALLSRNFAMDVWGKEEGYIETAWMHSWTGEYQMNYRVKITIKFNKDRKALQFKPQAHYMIGPNQWIEGRDSRLVSTFKSDLMGILSRTTR